VKYAWAVTVAPASSTVSVPLTEHRVEHQEQHDREDQAEDDRAPLARNAGELVAGLYQDEPEVSHDAPPRR
jgi:hypothetical protein